MKRTQLKKIGKWGRLWIKERAKLKKIYQNKGITICELNFSGCWHNEYLGFAHLEKRAFYRQFPHLLGSFNHTLLACNYCHGIIENDRELTKKMFDKLRLNIKW
uniref:HNH endonuclease n=1 Tax=viral metagenome TaxID=1070528 RepID=A0A6H1ZEH1_9ZZZZ